MLRGWLLLMCAEGPWFAPGYGRGDRLKLYCDRGISLCYWVWCSMIFNSSLSFCPNWMTTGRREGSGREWGASRAWKRLTFGVCACFVLWVCICWCGGTLVLWSVCWVVRCGHRHTHALMCTCCSGSTTKLISDYCISKTAQVSQRGEWGRVWVEKGDGWFTGYMKILPSQKEALLSFIFWFLDWRAKYTNIDDIS
jgi:hypothetical protein